MRFVEDKKYLPLLSYDTVSTAGAVTHVARVVIALLIRIRVVMKTMTMKLMRKMEMMLMRKMEMMFSTCHCSANGSVG